MPGKTRISGTKEWSNHSVNCCLGCSHDCRYCYARAMAVRFGRTTLADWRLERIKPDAERMGRRRYSGTVMFPTTHDITPANLHVTARVLGNLLEFGNRVLIVSKPHLECIEHICTRFSGNSSQILFRFTIGAYDDGILSFWEPGAPPWEERLASLRLAGEQGFETSVSCEPLLQPEDAVGLVGRLLPYVTDTIWIGKANQLELRTRGVLEPDHPAILHLGEWQTSEAVHTVYRALRDFPRIRWKESYKEVLGLKPAASAGLDL